MPHLALCRPPQEREGAVKQSPGSEGPHNLPQGEQERCVVEGRRIDGGGQCTVIVIRDRRHDGWVFYPHGDAGLGVLLAADAVQVLTDRLKRRTPEGEKG